MAGLPHLPARACATMFYRQFIAMQIGGLSRQIALQRSLGEGPRGNLPRGWGQVRQVASLLLLF